MGAEFQSFMVPDQSITELKAHFKSVVEQCRYDHGHAGYTGTFAEVPGITMQHRTFDRYEDAEHYLQDTCQKWENAIAVHVTDDEGEKSWMVGAWCSS